MYELSFGHVIQFSVFFWFSYSINYSVSSSLCQFQLVKFAPFQNFQICDCQNDIEKEVPLQADIHEESRTTDGGDGDLGILRGW